MTGLYNSEDYELAAVTDMRLEVGEELKREYPQIRTFTKYQDMLEQRPTDVVCVSTYAPTHEEITLAALKQPGLRGLLVEKPIGHSAASGRRIVEAARKQGIPMVVPHGLLTRRTPAEIITKVQNGEIGDLKLVEVQNDKWDIFNAGIHWFNFFVMLTGVEQIDHVLAICDLTTRTYRDGMQVETAAVTNVQTKSGIRLVMSTGDFVNVNVEGKGVVFRLVGTKGQIEFYGWESGYHIQNASHPGGEFLHVGEFPNAGHQLHLENLAQMIETGKSDYSVAESSLIALELCEAAYLSSKHHCKVQFPFEKFTPPAPVEWEPGQPYSGTGGGRDGRKL